MQNESPQSGTSTPSSNGVTSYANAVASTSSGTGASQERLPTTGAAAEDLSSPMKLSDVLKRKRGPKRGAVGARKSRACTADSSSADSSSSAATPSTTPSNLLPTGPGCTMDGHDYLRSSGAARSNKFGFPASGNGTPPLGGGAKASSFLANLNPARWGRSGAAASSGNSTATAAAPLAVNPTASASSSPSGGGGGGVGKNSAGNPQLAGNRDKVKTWIKEQAGSFLTTYFAAQDLLLVASSSSTTTTTPVTPAAAAPAAAGVLSPLSILGELTDLVKRLDDGGDAKVILEQIRRIVADSDVSSFEILHSGLVRALLRYLTDESGAQDRNTRLRTFLQVRSIIFIFTFLYGKEVNCYAFAQEFLHCTPETESPSLDAAPHLLALISKLSGCVNQLEQFPVRVHDLPAPAGTSGTSGGYFRSGTSALRFFNTHQLKCNLQRHPACNNVKQWKGGPVKIDPLALVQVQKKKKKKKRRFFYLF